MSKPANTSLIGIFVLGGILLLILAIGIFGASNFSTKQFRFICFFEDSVNGLDIGSPVKFKGVTVGKVAHVLLRVENQAENDTAVPVIIEIDQKLLSSRGIITSLTDEEERTSIIVNKGFRARLQQLSLITGMLYIEMDFFSGTEAIFHKADPQKGLSEIPTITSNMGTLMRAVTLTIEQVSQINFVQIGEKIQHILNQVEVGVNEVDFKGINDGILGVANSAKTLVENPEFKLAATNLNTALKEFQALSEKLAAQVDPTSEDLHKTAIETRKTLDHINQAAENLRFATQPGTGLRAELDETLQDIAQAAQAIRTLANYLERNPSVIITGKAEDDSTKNSTKK